MSLRLRCCCRRKFFLPKGLVSDGITSPQVVLRRHSLFVHDDEAENVIKSAGTGFLL